MGNSNKRIERSRTDHIRIYKKDWLVVDEVAGEDRPMKDGFHDIMEVYEKYKDVTEIEKLDELGES